MVRRIHHAQRPGVEESAKTRRVVFLADAHYLQGDNEWQLSSSPDVIDWLEVV